MSEQTNQISPILSSGNYQLFQNRLYVQSGSGEGKGTKQSSSKYIVNNNSFVYERYDRYGKIIYTVPGSAHQIDRKSYPSASSLYHWKSNGGGL